MTIYTPKTIPEKQQEYFQALSDANSGLRLDNTQGSVIYTLSRATAAIAVAQDVAINKLANSINLSNASGTDLDVYSTYGLYRGVASGAFGTILCLNRGSEIQIAPNTVLIDTRTGLQYATLNTTGVNVSYLEVPIKVRALTPGYSSNLKAGSRLYSTQYPVTSFVVGLKHAVDNTYQGDLTSGTDTEDDDSFRNRIATWMLSHSTSSKSIVLNRLLSFPGVTKAFSYTNVGGVLELWVDSFINFDASQKLELINYVSPFVSSGIILTISQVTRKSVDLNISIKPFQGSDLDTLSNRVKQLISSFISKLQVGQDLSITALQTLLKPLAAEVLVKLPIHDYLINPGEMAVLGIIDVTYPVS